MQHGDAVPKDADPDRPLSETGRRDAERLAAFLARQEVRVGVLWHSGRTRARQTAELLQWAVSHRVQAEAREGLAPDDPVAPWVEEVAAWRSDGLLVGHLPFVGRLVSLLAAGSEERGAVSFQPGVAACLERTGERRWSILWVVRPEILATEE